MAYVVYNLAAATYSDESQPDQGDFLALGRTTNGVLTGCGTTANGTNMTLSVAAGVADTFGDEPAVAGSS